MALAAAPTFALPALPCASGLGSRLAPTVRPHAASWRPSVRRANDARLPCALAAVVLLTGVPHRRRRGALRSALRALAAGAPPGRRRRGRHLLLRHPAVGRGHGAGRVIRRAEEASEAQEAPEADVDQLRQQADAGDAAAQLQLGQLLLEKGIGEPATAVDYLVQAGQNGVVEGLFNAGVCLLSEGALQDVDRGMLFLEKAAQEGVPDAQFTLGNIYTDGRLVPQDMDKATDYFSAASEQGVAPAQYQLGSMLLETPPGAVEAKKWAAHWLNQAAEQGEPRAQLLVGRMFLFGVYLEENPAAAAEWFSSSANGGNPEGQYMMGCCLLTGTGVDANPEWSKYWLEKASESGIPDAMRCLQWLSGDQLERAQALAAYHIGMIGIEEEGATSYDRAQQLLIFAADKGNSDAQYVLGKMYLDTPQTEDFVEEKKEAARLLTAAAEQGDSRAQMAVGKIYMFGLGAEKDEAKAREFVKLAAIDGLKDAQNLLGTMFLQGSMGMEEDKAAAAEWLEKAARQGHPDAQYNFGMMLATGDGVEKDAEQARFWIEQSEAAGPTAATAAEDNDLTNDGMGTMVASKPA